MHTRYMTYHGMRYQLNFTPCYGDADDLGKKIIEILWTGLGPLSFWKLLSHSWVFEVIHFEIPVSFMPYIFLSHYRWAFLSNINVSVASLFYLVCARSSDYICSYILQFSPKYVDKNLYSYRFDLSIWRSSICFLFYLSPSFSVFSLVYHAEKQIAQL